MCPLLFLPSLLSLPPKQAQPLPQPQAQQRFLVQLKGGSERPRPSKEP